MVRLKKRDTVGSSTGLDESMEPFPAHEGERPDRADVVAYDRWRRVRHARYVREVGGPNDPRHLIFTLAPKDLNRR